MQFPEKSGKICSSLFYFLAPHHMLTPIGLISFSPTGLLRRSFFLILGLSLSLLVGVASASADSIYAVTETTATVGTAQSYELEYTVDTELQTWVGGDTLTIQLPANYPQWAALTYTIEYDMDDTNQGAGETGPLGAGSGDGQYLVATDTITVKWAGAWGAPINGGSTIRVLITGSAAPIYADATSTFTFGGATAADDTTPAGSDTVNVSAADASVTVSLGTNAVVGTAGTTTINFGILPTVLDPGDTIDITFPAFIDISAVDAQVATGSLDNGDAATITCQDYGQVLTCTVSVANTLTTGDIIVTGVISSYVGTTDLTSAEVEDEGVDANDIVIATTAGGGLALTDTTVGALTSTSLTPATTANTHLSAYTVAFTTVGTTMLNESKVKITFPSGYILTSMSGNASHLSGLDGTWAISVSGQIVTLTQSGGGTTAPGAKSLRISNVRNPAATGATGTFTLTTTTSASAEIQTATPAAINIVMGTESIATIGDLSGISVMDNGDGGVKILWTDPDDDTTDVQILRGVDSTPVSGTVYATADVSEEAYVDYDLEAGQTVKYILRGTDGSDTGDLSDEYSFVVGSGVTVESGDEASITEEEVDETISDDTGEETTDDSSSSDEPVSFTDLSSHWAEAAVMVMAEEGVILGYDDGTFKPDGKLNRAEAAAMLWRVLGLGDPSEVSVNPFTDVASTEWYAAYVAGLKGLELVDGNPDGTYQPGEEINRAEFLQLAMNVYAHMMGSMTDASMTQHYADLDTGAWYAQVVSNATTEGFVGGSACTGGFCFKAGTTISRAEAATILNRMFYDGELVDTSFVSTTDEEEVSDSSGMYTNDSGSGSTDTYADEDTTDTSDTSDDTSTMSEADAIAALSVTLQSYGDISVYNGSSTSVDLLGYYITDEHGFKYTFSSELGTGESIDVDPDGGLTADDGSTSGYITLTLYGPSGNSIFSINEDM